LKPAPIPDNEAARLSKLAEYDIVDTAVESAFDTLTTLTAELLGVPIALISIIDSDRQWFKSRYGLDAPSTPRDISFCGHVVADERALIVPDAFADPRFADNPLSVGEPRVRFYAGMPLRTPDGFVLGTLCAIDHAPRTLTDAQRRTLNMLAEQVVALLELRRGTRLLNEQQAQLGSYARYFESSSDLFSTADSSLHFCNLNQAWTRTLGWSLEELRAHPFLHFVHPDDLEATKREAGRLLSEASSVVNFQNRYQHKHGHWVPLSWTAFVADGTFFSTARDLTAEREVTAAVRARDEELARSEARLRAVFEGMAEGVVSQDASGEILACNPSAEVILGLSRDQMCGRTSIDPRWRAIHEDGSGFPGEIHPAMVALRTGKRQVDVPMGVHKPDGQLTWISVNAIPIHVTEAGVAQGVICTFRDVTEQRAATQRLERLSRQERLVTTGTLAAGVGHEINNPLSYVLSNLEYSIEEVTALAGGSPSGRLRELVENLTDARSGAERIRKIVRGLSALARDDAPPVPTDLHSMVDVASNMAMHELRQRATLQVELPHDLPPVMADESRVTQVLVNLLVNAAQAFSSADPSTNRVTVDATLSGDMVSVCVRDNGHGIAPEVLPRIFDPFFTTKAVGKGTGLGLSISHSIVTALGGELSCDSTVGVGSTFTVRLPIAARAPELAPRSMFPADEPSGRVLIVDDEESVVRSLQRVLAGAHLVVSETDPRVALARLAAGEQFDVIFCDLMMPHLTGPELFRRAVEANPKLADRFVFITGGVSRADIHAFLAEVRNERLEKPVGLQTLRSTVRRFLANA